ncbi:MAG: phosphatase PAP2 family protein [Dehalococcoidia bacterium]
MTASAVRGRAQRAWRIGTRPTRCNLLHWASWGVALGAQLALVAGLHDGTIFEWEQDLTRWCQSISGRNLLFDVTSSLTNTLAWYFVAGFVALVLATAAAGRPGEAAMIALTFPLHVLAQFPKALIDRPRPSADFPGIEGVGGFQSFPSGHAEFVVTFYGLLAFIAVRGSGRARRTLVLTAWLAFVLATGFGRVAAGRHWPLDVLASYVVGAGLLSGLIWIDHVRRESRAWPC